MLKNHISFLILSILQHCVPPLSETPPLIGQLAHAWANTANNNRAAALNQFLCAQLAVRLSVTQMCDIVMSCDVTQLKARLLTRRFGSSVFCGREELLLKQTLIFKLSRSFTKQNKRYQTLKEKKETKKHKMSPFKLHRIPTDCAFTTSLCLVQCVRKLQLRSDSDQGLW